MDTQILRRNVRGLLHDLDDVKELLHKFSPEVLCVQETHLKSTATNFLRHYSTFGKHRDDALASSGGVAVIVGETVAPKHLKLQSPLEAVAVRALLFNKLVTIASVYVPPNYQLHEIEFQSLIDELP